MSKCKAISENEQSIIVRNILGAKDKRKQVQIEADLHESSIGIIKDILKEHGINLRILNGGSHKKKHIEDELIDEAPKEQAIINEAVEAVKDFDAALSKGEQIEEQEHSKTANISQEEKQQIFEASLAAQREKKQNEPEPIIIGSMPKQIFSEDEVLDSIRKKVAGLIKERRELKAQLDAKDQELAKYVEFFSAEMLQIETLRKDGDISG
ncbi:hypothetical protein [uncultured Ruminococcus sp.]|uniref:hypothetical protein n=1 Tax=uncultured Ruminococcus sp. TaxID=165186 RepID=UPI0026205B9E|nr:hypothetical protein [uncultured Ruminococcus sp.]